MANHKESLGGQQSLDLIHKMINRAKGKINSGSFYFLIWGWIIFAGSIGHFVLLEFTSVNHPEWAWSIIVIGIIASFWQGFKDRNRRGAATYPARVYRAVWLTFLLNYLIILIFMADVNFYISPIILVMAGSSTYMSGTIIKFNPLKWGAAFIWGMAIIGFLVALPYQLLATAAAVLIGYLVPGYLLKKSEKEA